MDLRRAGGRPSVASPMRDDGSIDRGDAGRVEGSCYSHQVLSRQNQQDLAMNRLKSVAKRAVPRMVYRFLTCAMGGVKGNPEENKLGGGGKSLRSVWACWECETS